MGTAGRLALGLWLGASFALGTSALLGCAEESTTPLSGSTVAAGGGGGSGGGGHAGGDVGGGAPGGSGGSGGGLVEGAYVVSPDGDDDGPGTPAAPWRTVGKAAQTLVAGETVYIRAGTYAERLVPTAAGEPDAVITYAAYPGEEPMLDGTGVALGDGLSGLVEIRSLHHIRVAGLRVIHAGSEDTHAGIIVIDSESIAVERCRTYDTRSSGIGVWHSADVAVRNNEVELACNDGSQECITISATDGFEVSGNHVHHGGPGTNGGEGIDTKESATNGVVRGNLVHDLERLGIYVDGWDGALHDVEVAANVVHDTSLGFAVAVENGGFAERVTFVNNVAYANRWAGLVVASWGVEGASHAMADIAIVNNSFVGNGPGSWGPGIVLDNAAADRVLVRNNLLAHNVGEQIECPAIGAELVVDHNLFFGDGSSLGTDAVTGDPRITELTTGDVHLLAGSAAIDVGASSEAPPSDLDGDARPLGAGIDIGADERRP